ncbi:MAG: serine hydrolase domain-containing protein [Candidatus Kapaibacterium sp.]
MNTFIKNVSMFLAVFLFHLLISCSDDGVSNPPENKELINEIDRICDSIITDTKLPGMLVGIWDAGLNLNYVKGHGVSELSGSVPFEPNQLFRIGSNTKSFVVTRILQLVDEKTLSLYDKLSKFYPDFPNAESVTIKMLCDMTSGIYNFTETSEFDNIFLNDPLHKWTIEEKIDIAAKYDYYFTPGTDLKYSNTNTVLLGGIIETIDEQPLGEVLKSKLFEKYDLKNTYYPTDNKMPNNHYIHGYETDGSGTGEYDIDVTEFFDLTWAGAAGAIISDIYDVKKWVTMLIDGDMISDSLHSQIFEGKTFTGSTLTYGKAVYSYAGTEMWGHNGGLPGFTSVMMRHTKMDRTIVVFYNLQGTPNPDHLFLRIVDLLNNTEQ